MEFYHSTHSIYSRKVRLCLAEKGLAWSGHHLNPRRFDQLKPEFLALTGATLAFDAIGGGKLAGQILACMEAAINRTAKEYPYRNGSPTRARTSNRG